MWRCHYSLLLQRCTTCCCFCNDTVARNPETEPSVFYMRVDYSSFPSANPRTFTHAQHVAVWQQCGARAWQASPSATVKHPAAAACSQIKFCRKMRSCLTTTTTWEASLAAFPPRSPKATPAAIRGAAKWERLSHPRRHHLMPSPRLCRVALPSPPRPTARSFVSRSLSACESLTCLA